MARSLGLENVILHTAHVDFASSATGVAKAFHGAHDILNPFPTCRAEAVGVRMGLESDCQRQCTVRGYTQLLLRIALSPIVGLSLCTDRHKSLVHLSTKGGERTHRAHQHFCKDGCVMMGCGDGGTDASLANVKFATYIDDHRDIPTSVQVFFRDFAASYKDFAGSTKRDGRKACNLEH